jgi:hypothetical protein
MPVKPRTQEFVWAKQNDKYDGEAFNITNGDSVTPASAGLGRRSALHSLLLPGPGTISRVQDNATVAYGPEL